MKLQEAIGQYVYQHIGTIEKITVISLMKTSVKFSSLRQHNSFLLTQVESQWIMSIHTHCTAEAKWRWLYLDTLTPRSRKWEDGRENRLRNISTKIFRVTQEGCQGTWEDNLGLWKLRRGQIRIFSFIWKIIWWSQITTPEPRQRHRIEKTVEW